MNYADITEVTRVAEGLPASAPAPREGGFSTGTAVASCSENHPATKSSPGRTTRPLASISEKRLAANRANAQKSTGPRTVTGKAAVAENACRTRFFARVHRMPSRIAAHFKARAEEKTRCIADPARRALHFDWWMLDGHRILHESRERALFNAGIEHANGDEAAATAWVLRQSGYIEALNRYAGWIQARLRKVELALASDPDLLESELVQMNPIEPELQQDPPASEPSIHQPNPILAEQTHLAAPSQSVSPKPQQPKPLPQHSLRHCRRPAPTPTSPDLDPEMLPLENLTEQTHFPSHPSQQPAPLPQHSLRHCRRPAATPTSPDPNPETLPLENLAEATSAQESAMGSAQKNLADQTHFPHQPPQQPAPLPQHSLRHCWGPAATSISPDPNPETLPLENLAEAISSQDSALGSAAENLAEQTHFATQPPSNPLRSPSIPSGIAGGPPQPQRHPTQTQNPPAGEIWPNKPTAPARHIIRPQPGRRPPSEAQSPWTELKLRAG